MDCNVLDISLIFWQFVTNVTTMPYEMLSETEGFQVLSHNALEARPLALNCSDLGLVDADDIQNICTHCNKWGGFTHDTKNKRFVFPDVTSLLRNSPLMVKDRHKRLLLKDCLSKINSHVEISELSDDLKMHVLQD